jgi:hypothetical protein
VGSTATTIDPPGGKGNPVRRVTRRLSPKRRTLLGTASTTGGPKGLRLGDRRKELEYLRPATEERNVFSLLIDRDPQFASVKTLVDS